MDTLDKTTPPPRTPVVSAEAIIGMGISAGALGVLSLLLGWAQTMRLERESAWIFLPIGAFLVVCGGIAALTGSLRKVRR